MRNTLAIARKEFRSYFSSAIAYIFITLFLAVSGWLFMSTFFLVGEASMRGYFQWIPWLLMIFVPAVSMRLWAEEKKLGTIELLMTFPLSDAEVVVGKFLAALGFISVTLGLSFPVAITVAVAGDPDWGPILGAYLGSLLLAATFLAIGVFFSSITENQVVALLLAFFTSLFLYIAAMPIFLVIIPDVLDGFFAYLSPKTHYDSVQRGVIDSRDVIYYLSLIGFFLFLNTRSVQSRKWK